MKGTKLKILFLVLFFSSFLNFNYFRNVSAAALSPAQATTCNAFFAGQRGPGAGAPEYCFPSFVKEFVRGINYESSSQTFAQKLTGECCHHPTMDTKIAFYRHSIAWVSRPGSNPWDPVVVTPAEMSESQWIQLDLWSVRYSCDAIIDAPVSVCKPLKAGAVQLQEKKNDFYLFRTDRIQMGWYSEQYHKTFPTKNNNFVKIFDAPFSTETDCSNVFSTVGAGMERFIRLAPIGVYKVYSNAADNIVNYPKITQGINSQLRTFTDFYQTNQPSKKVEINPRQLYEICKDPSAKGCELIEEDLVNGDVYKIFLGGLSAIDPSHGSCTSSGALTGNIDVDNLSHSRCENSSTQPLYIRVKRPEIIEPTIFVESTVQKNSVPPIVKNSDANPKVGNYGPGVEISVGDTAYFTHKITVTYAGDLQKETLVRYKIDNIGANGAITNNISNPTAGSANFQLIPVPSDSNPAIIPLFESHKASISDRNKVYCRRISYELINGSGIVLKSGNLSPVCTKVSFNYELNPIVTNSATSASPGDVITTSPEVVLKNDSNVDSEWKLTQMVFSPSNFLNYSKLPDTKLTNNLDPISHFNNFGPSGSTIVIDFGKNTFLNVNTLLPTHQSVLNYPIGTRICFALSLSPWSSQSGSALWVHSVPACVSITKQPNAQIHGGVLKVPKGKIVGTTGIRGVNLRTFGSWAEYDILAKGLVTNTASNAGYLTFTGQIGDMRELNWLTFSNNVPSALGKFSDSMSVSGAETVAKYFKGGKKGEPSPLILDLSNWINNFVAPNLTGHKNYDGGNLTITGTNPISIPWSKSAVIVVENGDLIISQNIDYQGSATNIRDLPQLIFVVLNGNIKINQSVTKVDAWLIAVGSNTAKGHLVTCNIPKVDININTCNQRLIINGPVMVDYIDLLRTAGMEQNDVSDTAAETINFRPDAYLWSQKNQSEDNLILSTTYLRELPPRY